MNKDDTFETMLDPKTRVINQLNVKQDNADEIDSFFTLFMGKDTEARKTFVKENLRNAKIEV